MLTVHIIFWSVCILQNNHDIFGRLKTRGKKQPNISMTCSKLCWSQFNKRWNQTFTYTFTLLISVAPNSWYHVARIPTTYKVVTSFNNILRYEDTKVCTPVHPYRRFAQPNHTEQSCLVGQVNPLLCCSLKKKKGVKLLSHTLYSGCTVKQKNGIQISCSHSYLHTPCNT